MSWLIEIIIFAAGLIAGLLAARFFPQLSGKHKTSEVLAEQKKAQDSFKQEVNDYLNSVNQAMKNIAEQANQAATESQQQYTKLTNAQKEHKEIVPFFGAETAAIIEQSKVVERENKNRIDSKSEERPLDYSESKMGWFSDQTQK